MTPKDLVDTKKRVVNCPYCSWSHPYKGSTFDAAQAVKDHLIPHLKEDHP